MSITPTTKTGKELQGIVVSDKMDKTVVVRVDRFFKAPKYGKYITRSKRLKAHDPENRCQEGDKVTIRETKPWSKDKTFAVVYDAK
ncbi:MAG: 30S ribosomal protein S17 [Candidatus Vogelbacteria bacterium]|nr:30S ribosomal protein S17 [Candidatus Vogelbacteria bacterium]